MITTRSFLRFLPFLIIAAGLATAYALGLQDHLSFARLASHQQYLEAEVANLGAFGPAIYGLFYMIVTAFALPVAGVLTVFGGFLFGWVTASIVVALSATLGATLVFLAARSAAGDGLRNRLKGRIAALSQGFENDAFVYLLVLRLTPLFPFFIVNVAPAFFKVRLATYVATTFLGILPGTVTLAFLGQGIDRVLDSAEAAGRPPTLADVVTPQITLALGALALMAIVAAMLKTWWTRRVGAKENSGAR
ncbi:TVP38/TMEM64 family protein [Aliihoeflea sp. PC F10.4]